jgi:hypothetical protein
VSTTPLDAKARWVAEALKIPPEKRMAFLYAVRGGERLSVARDRFGVSFAAAMGIIEIHVDVLTNFRSDIHDGGGTN